MTLSLVSSAALQTEQFQSAPHFGSERTGQRHLLMLSKQYAIEAIIENLEKALGRRPVKVGKDASEIYVYRGDVANRALQMIGHELGLFTEKKEIAHSIGEFKQYTDEELVQILEHEAQALLAHHSAT